MSAHFPREGSQKHRRNRKGWGEARRRSRYIQQVLPACCRRAAGSQREARRRSGPLRVGAPGGCPSPTPAQPPFAPSPPPAAPTGARTGGTILACGRRGLPSPCRLCLGGRVGAPPDLCLSVPGYLCISVSCSLPISDSLHLPVSVSLCISLSLGLSLHLPVSGSLPASLSLPRSLSRSLGLCFSLSLREDRPTQTLDRTPPHEGRRPARGRGGGRRRQRSDSVRTEQLYSWKPQRRAQQASEESRRGS